MSSIDQQFVEYIVKSLVGQPDSVSIERTIDERGVLLKLTVAEDDLGRVIGKRGSTAQSIRTLLRALGTKNDARYNLKIVDPTGGPSAPKPDADAVDSDGAVSVAEPVADEPSQDAPVAEEPAEEPAAAETQSSNLADKTRKELAEFDDLDI
jgi:hypothetical protein